MPVNEEADGLRLLAARAQAVAGSGAVVITARVQRPDYSSPRNGAAMHSKACRNP
jgi:hypothetical protein